jgi:hypothetical protein
MFRGFFKQNPDQIKRDALKRLKQYVKTALNCGYTGVPAFTLGWLISNFEVQYNLRNSASVMITPEDILALLSKLRTDSEVKKDTVAVFNILKENPDLKQDIAGGKAQKIGLIVPLFTLH